MKKVFLTLALAAFAFAANAQFVIGGNLGFNTTGYSNKNVNGDAYINPAQPKDLNFNIDLKAGYQLNDKMQLGLIFGIETGRSLYETPKATEINTVAYSQKDKHFGLDLMAYFRYNVCEFGHFTFFAEATAGIETGNTKTVYKDDPINGNETFKNTKDFAWGINVVPGMNYAFNDNFSMDLYLNFIGLGFNSYTRTGYIYPGEKTASTTMNEFGFNFQSSGMTIDYLTRMVTVGFNYHF